MTVIQSFKPANMVLPTPGSLAMAYRFTTPVNGIVTKDFQAEQAAGIIDTIQSVFIDNANNPAQFIMTFRGAVPPYRIVAQPFSQGFYPVTAPIGPLFVTVSTTAGLSTDTIFYNCPMPYFTWGAIDGVLQVPPLVNLPIDIAAMVVGDNVLVAGIPGQTIRVYRLLFSTDAGGRLRFFSGSGAGTKLFGSVFLFGGGSIMLQPSGVAWMSTLPGESLVLTSDTASALGGQLGYIQS